MNPVTNTLLEIVGGALLVIAVCGFFWVFYKAHKEINDAYDKSKNKDK